MDPKKNRPSEKEDRFDEAEDLIDRSKGRFEKTPLPNPKDYDEIEY